MTLVLTSTQARNILLFISIALPVSKQCVNLFSKRCMHRITVNLPLVGCSAAGSHRQHSLHIWDKATGSLVKILTGHKGETLLDIVVS